MLASARLCERSYEFFQLSLCTNESVKLDARHDNIVQEISGHSFSEGAFIIKQQLLFRQLSKMIFSHGAINMALAPRPHPPFHKEGALASTAVGEGGDGLGTKQKNEHVSQLFILC